MFNIIERLPSSEFHVIILIEQSSEASALEAEVRRKGYEVLVLRSRFLRNFSLNAFITAIGVLRRHRIDIWQSFDYTCDFLEPLLAAAVGARYGYIKKNMNWSRKAWKLKSFLSTFIIARNTSLVQRQFNSVFFRRKTTLITGAVDAERFSRLEGESVKKKYPGRFVVCCVAQLIPVKGHRYLIHAMQGLPSEIELWIVGSGPETYLHELQTLVAVHGLEGRVLFHGFISDVRPLLSACDLYILPTCTIGGHEEGCPVSLLEAMSMEVPCIATDVAGSRDLIAHLENGILVKPDSSESVRDAILYAWQNPDIMKEFATRSRQRVLLNHTLTIEAMMFAKVYRAKAS